MSDQTDSARRLSTQEAARALGVKPATVYAYVSRGQLTSRRDPTGRGSSFDAAEVAALARRSRREAAAPTGEPSVRTALTLIEPDRYYFRGVDAVELASRYRYEEVAEWLWTGALTPGARFTAPPQALEAARRAVAALPEHGGPIDRLRVAVAAAAVADPLRFDLSEEAVLGSARALIPTLVGALPAVGRPARWAGDGRIARQLWSRLTAREPDPDALAVLDLALALLVDHDLAASTLAVRVAASARAHPYAAVSAGLGVLEGPLHGAAGRLAHRMLVEVLEQGGAAPVVAEYLRAGRRVPGLGHRLYQGEDPRARVLFASLEGLEQAGPALGAAREVATVMARQGGLHANVDLALAVLTVSCGMPAEAGETVFAVARTAGWIAHALEEYQERPLRMRPSGQYHGPRPPQPMP
ncbi:MULTISPECIES: citrate synthase [unclassified Streptomyces]|uniref:citrate synthase n=1 Tax=unclassified Streptomyces TaxID=2593676 RepID=UPI002E2A46A2|nr:citrate synthase [Streptomyces sp. NBC_01439]